MHLDGKTLENLVITPLPFNILMNVWSRKFDEFIDNCLYFLCQNIVVYNMLLQSCSIVSVRFVTLAGVSSVDVLVMMPVIFLTLGKDFIALICFCYITSLLIITQLPKRLIWRYRPYMVSRAKMVRLI